MYYIYDDATGYFSLPYSNLHRLSTECYTLDMILPFFWHKYPRYTLTEKRVGETPLVAAERLREELKLPKEVPLAYAGRLDPMASGKLLILIGNECKKQKKYHTLDKEYKVEVLFGAQSDTGDVLGILSECPQALITEADCRKVLKKNIGTIQLPYPNFSSKTVQGKPLHVWTLEKRSDEIEIPIKKSRIYNLTFTSLRTISKDDILKTVRAKIETIPEVTDPKKALGADFRRVEVRKTWDDFEAEGKEVYQILSFTCIASSGTYMRSLAEKLGRELKTCGLAYSIHRTEIGKYVPITSSKGFWRKRF